MERTKNIETIPEEGPTTGIENPAGDVGNLIDVDGDTTTSANTTTTTDISSSLITNTPITTLEPIVSSDAQKTNQQQSPQPDSKTVDPLEEITTNCDKCKCLQIELDRLKTEKLNSEQRAAILKTKLETNTNELEREVKRRVDLEQQFTEEAKRTTDQIEELIAKSDRDDAKLNELKKRFELYSRETSSMIESFTTNREILTSQLLELRKENDYLLGKYMGKARDLQSEEINLPQNVEELQFHCLTLNEKLILATLAKERLEETLINRDSNHSADGSTSLIDHTTSATTSG